MWLALLASSAVAEAPKAAMAHLRGVVVDETGLAIPGVDVTLSGTVIHHTQTDADGRYTFPAIPPGTYRVAAVRDGFTPQEQDRIQLQLGDEISVVLVLKVEDEPHFYWDCEPLTHPTQLDVGLQLRDWFVRDVPTGNAFPVSDPMGEGVGSRAAPPDALLWGQRQGYLLDGVNVSDPVSGAPAVHLSPEVLATRSVFSTVVDPQGAHGLDGMVQMHSATGSNAAEGSVDVRGGGERLRSGVTVAGPIARDHVWLHADHSLVRAGEADAQTLSGKLTAQPTAQHRVQLSARTASPAEPSGAGGGSVASGTWDWFWGPEAYTQTQVSALRLDDIRWRAAGGSTLRLFNVRAGGSHDIKAGAQYTGEGDEYGVTHHLSGYVQDVYHPISALVVVAGLRAEQSTYAAFSEAGLDRVQALGPRVGMSWSPYFSHQTVLKAAAWRTHSMLGMQLTPAQLSSLFGDSTPAAPRTDGVTVGAEQALGDVLVQAYHSWRSAQNRYRAVDGELEAQSWQEQRLDVLLSWEYPSPVRAVGRYTLATEDGNTQHDAMLGVVGRMWGAWGPRLGLFGAMQAQERAWTGTVNGRYWQRIPVKDRALYTMVQLDGVARTDDQARTLRAGLRYEW